MLPLYVSHSWQDDDRVRRPQNRLECSEVDLPVSTSIDNTPGLSQTIVLWGIGCSSSYLPGQSILVSGTAAGVRISLEISTSCTSAEGSGEDSHRPFLSFLGPSCMGFLHRCFIRKYGLHITRYLIHDLKESSIRQYVTAWMALLRYVRLEKLSSFEEKTILGFLVWLFEKYDHQANTITYYRSALVKPLSVVFCVSIGSRQFAELAISFFNVRPPSS